MIAAFSIPGPWHAAILALAAYRLTRLAGWDEFPLAVKIRAWLIGEEWVVADDQFAADLRRAMDEQIEEPIQPVPRLEFVVPNVPAGVEKAEGTGRMDAAELGLPGKQPTSEVAEVRPAYRRPTLAHLVHCPFCVGWWLSLAVYGAWLAAPRATLYAMLPFALSGAVGLIAKNLDP